MLNLLSNSIKFTPPSGEIWLKAGWTASGGQYLSVKDTGSGIAEEEIPIVLASFGQGSNSIKSAEQGAGLGLPIAKSLIDMHGGTFTLKSQLRIGTEDRHLAGGVGDVGRRRCSPKKDSGCNPRPETMHPPTSSTARATDRS